MINVSKPHLPPREDYERFLDGIWERNWLTNNGPLVQELEAKLRETLGVRHVLFTSNGTIALQIAIKALNLTGEIITTPFSYVATTSSIVWENCRPVMVDIDPKTLMINPELIERAITDKTSAILATHVFGNICDVEEIQRIAKRHNIPVIYDGAHCFGTTFKGESIFNWGDISTASFHATKLFHTIEGGALFTQSDELYQRMILLRNFGHIGPTEFADVGINGKNSEFHAAMGLCILPKVPAIIRLRSELVRRYDENLRGVSNTRPEISADCKTNYAYYPIMFESETVLLKAVSALNLREIYPRRYFYPSLDTLPYVDNQSAVPVSRDISSRILCLPLYDSLTFEEIDLITSLIQSC